jgi:hypothetical protein
MRELRERVKTAVQTRGGAVARHIPAMLRAAEVVLGVAAVGYVGFLLADQLDPTLFRPAAPVVSLAPIHVTPPPKVIPVLDSHAVGIDAGEHLEVAFEVDDPRECTLTGRIEGLAGGSRDVEVFLLDDEGFSDWYNGVPPQPLYYSGRTDAVTLHVRIPGRGEYHLLISNRYSFLTDKVVSVRNAQVRCE